MTEPLPSVGSGWFGPQQCSEHCCGPPTPCEKPVVTCKKYDDGPYTSAKFSYEIENATEAWVIETCTGPYGSVTTTRHEIELDEEGNASGDYYTLSNCTYCVTATNPCGTVSCCDTCAEPICQLSASIDQYGTVTVSYEYRSNGDPIISADINGVSVLDSPDFRNGTLVFTRPNIPQSFVFTLVNDCGKTKTCTFNVPCCWRKARLRISISGISDLSWNCSYAGGQWLGQPQGVGGNIISFWHLLQMSYSLTGLGAINGTHLFNLEPDGRCRSNDSDKSLGSVQYYQSYYHDIDITNVMGVVRREEWKREVEGTVGLFLRHTGEVYIKWPVNGLRDWGFRKVNGVHQNFPPTSLSPFDIRFCGFPCFPLVNPPCQPDNCPNGIANSLAFSCGAIQLQTSRVYFPTSQLPNITDWGGTFPPTCTNYRNTFDEGVAETEYLA